MEKERRLTRLRDSRRETRSFPFMDTERRRATNQSGQEQTSGSSDRRGNVEIFGREIRFIITLLE